MKLRITAVVDIEFGEDDLVHYEATTPQEAAANLERWYKEGEADIIADLIGGDWQTTTVTVRED